jgi:hypothetical protein
MHCLKRQGLVGADSPYLCKSLSGTEIDVIVGEFGYSYLEHSQASTARALNILILYYNLARRSKANVKKGGSGPLFNVCSTATYYNYSRSQLRHELCPLNSLVGGVSGPRFTRF